MKTEPTRLALFDFDGTLTRGDTLLRFLVFAKGWRGALSCAFPLIFNGLRLFLSGRWSAEAAKSALLAVFFRGKTRSELALLGEQFCREKLPHLLRAEVFEKMLAHRQAGDAVALVSASVDFWLRPFAEKHGLALLCTMADFDANDCFSGNFATPNCNGQEKARRVAAHFDLAAFDKIEAYGNSAGDAAMLALAHAAHWV